MEKNNKITTRQLSIMAFISVFSPMIRLLPRFAVELGGKSVWLSPIVAAVPVLLFTLLVNALMKSRGEKEGLAEIICRIFGKAGGKIIISLYFLWIAFYGGFILRTAGERLVSSVYANSNIVIFVVVTILISLIAAFGKVKSLARTAEVFLPIILGVLIFSLAFSMADFEKDNLLPISYRNTENILAGAIPIADVMSIVVYFAFLAGNTKQEKKNSTIDIKWMLYLLITAFFFLAVTIGTLSGEIIAKTQNPFFIMIRNISIFGIIERIEAVVIALWILTDFMFLSSLIMIDAEIMKTITGVKGRMVFASIIAAAILLVSLLIAQSAFDMKIFSERIIPGLNIFFSYIVILLIFVVGKIRKKI